MREDSGPAFPQEGYTVDASGAFNGRVGVHPGMSLRDWFAGQAMGAYCAHTKLDTSKQNVAEWCYGMADALLAARKK